MGIHSVSGRVRSRVLIGMAAAAAAAMLAATADATVVNVTYSGSVAFGVDTTGAFGTANRDLSGLDFTVVYNVDLAALANNDFGFPGYFQGRQLASDASPQSTAAVTIGGASATVSGTEGAYISRVLYNPDVYGVSQGASNEVYGAGGNSVYTGLSGDDIFASLDLDTAFSYTATAGNEGRGNYNIGEGLYTIGLTVRQVSSTGIAAQADAGAVPEPATWAMMLIGFGAIGAGLRRSRASAVSFA